MVLDFFDIGNARSPDGYAKNQNLTAQFLMDTSIFTDFVE
jgi:hypothetical protein